MSVQRTMLLIWALAFVALSLAAVLYQHTNNQTAELMSPSRATVEVGSALVEAEVADTPALQTRGLSGRSGLAEGEGMLFVFSEEGPHPIWMKDMRFSIDIVWAAGDGTIVTIEERVPPESYPESFRATAPARYVLEVPAGFVARHGVAVGDTLIVR